jgi:hypothetical protein
MSKIFVMIPSLGDYSIKDTILDCINKAKNPENLTFGISLQNLNDLRLNDIKNEKRIVILDSNIVYGIGKTRYHIQQLYNEEDYILSIDCHTSFKQNWDELIINEYLKLNDEYAVISQFLHEIPVEDYKESIYEYSKIDAWAMKYFYSLDSNIVDDFRITQRVCPHFIFANKNFMNIDYPYFYFWGDEDHILSIKLFCNGFNIYELKNTYMSTVPKSKQACHERSNWFISAISKYDNYANYTLVDDNEIIVGNNSSINYDYSNIELSNHLINKQTNKPINQQKEAALLLENGYSNILKEDFRNTKRSIKQYFEFHGISWEKVEESICYNKQLGV